jgi:hypothetical protein
VPRIVPTQVGHCPKNGVLRGVDVAAGNCDRAVACDPRQRPSVATRLPQARQERMPKRVQHKWRKRPKLVLLRILVRRPKRPRVLLLEARMVNVPTCRRRGP